MIKVIIFHTLENVNHIFLAVLLRVVCIGETFRKSVVLYRGKNSAYKFIEAILKDNEYCKKTI